MLRRAEQPGLRARHAGARHHGTRPRRGRAAARDVLRDVSRLPLRGRRLRGRGWSVALGPRPHDVRGRAPRPRADRTENSTIAGDVGVPPAGRRAETFFIDLASPSRWVSRSMRCGAQARAAAAHGAARAGRGRRRTVSAAAHGSPRLHAVRGQLRPLLRGRGQPESLQVRPDEGDPFSRGFACPKGIAIAKVHDDPDRLRTPVKRNADGGFEPISWDERRSISRRRVSRVSGDRPRRAVGRDLLRQPHHPQPRGRHAALRGHEGARHAQQLRRQLAGHEPACVVLPLRQLAGDARPRHRPERTCCASARTRSSRTAA